MNGNITNKPLFILAILILIIGVVVVAINFLGQESLLDGFKASAFGFCFIGIGILFIGYSKKKSH